MYNPNSHPPAWAPMAMNLYVSYESNGAPDELLVLPSDSEDHVTRVVRVVALGRARDLQHIHVRDRARLAVICLENRAFHCYILIV